MLTLIVLLSVLLGLVAAGTNPTDPPEGGVGSDVTQSADCPSCPLPACPPKCDP